MKNFNKLLSIVKFLVEEGTEHVNLVRQRWVFHAKIIEPKSRNFRLRDCQSEGEGDLLQTKLNEGIVKIFFRLQPPEITMHDTERPSTGRRIH